MSTRGEREEEEEQNGVSLFSRSQRIPYMEVAPPTKWALFYGRGQPRGNHSTPPTVMASAGPPYINAAKIRELVSMREIIDAVERGLADFSSGKVTQPVRSVLEATEHGGYEVLL